MFATSTKTATFFPTLTPCLLGFGRRRRDHAARRHRSIAAAPLGGPDRGHLALSARTGLDETVTLEAGPLRQIVWQGHFHEGAALVACRPEDLLQERVDDAIRVVVRIDHDEIYRADEAAGLDRGSKREDRASDHLAPGLGDEDACLREIDQLSEQVS